MILTVEPVDLPTDDARRLIAELDSELGAAYDAGQRHGLSIERVFQPHILFFIARLDGASVGCGAVAFADGLAEVKRMYVRPAARGKRVATAILRRLEDEARKRGVTRLVLETGDAQLAAMQFYEREGFTRCGAFGAYSTMPAPAIERSRFFEKRLSAGGAG